MNTKKPECNCSMTTRTLGDGCSVCNPELAAEYEAMNTTEHLEKIKAKCKELLNVTSCDGPAEAGWLTTIEIIEALDDIEDAAAGRLVGAIIAAWPEELL